MAFLLQLKPTAEECINAASSSLSRIILQPIAVLGTLTQCNFEPIPPQPKISWFGTPYLQFPGLLTQAKWIYSNYGFTALYTGFGASILEQMIGQLFRDVTYRVVSNVLQIKPYKSAIGHARRDVAISEMLRQESGEEELSDDDEEMKDMDHLYLDTLPVNWKDSLIRFGSHLLASVVSLTVCGIVTQPFRMITTCMMAQIPGQEKVYSSFFSALKYVITTRGVSGLYEGFAPHILSALILETVVFSYRYWASCRIEEFYQQQETSRKQAADARTTHQKPEEKQAEMFQLDMALGMRQNELLLAIELIRLAVRPFVYPLALARTQTIIASSGLALGRPPYLIKRNSWADYAVHAWQAGGRNLLNRYMNYYYTGRTVYYSNTSSF